MPNYRRAYASIDLNALRYNVQQMRKITPKDVKLAAVVKVDGYGHGAVPIAKAIDSEVYSFCVATVDEAVNLRRHYITKPILILGPVPGDEYIEVVNLDICTTIFTMEQAMALQKEAQSQSKIAKIHIAVDTGMNRIGLKPNIESIALIQEIATFQNIEIEGIFSHFFFADGKDKTQTYQQITRFKNFLKDLEKSGIKPLISHISNSAGIIEELGNDFDMVRMGIIMYGIQPSDEVVLRKDIEILPVMKLYSCITYIKEIDAGEVVSYGGTFIAKERMRVGTIPMGYGDGYPRSLSNIGYVLVHGKRAKILGRICMDQMMVDVSDILEAQVGSSVTLIGRDGEEEIRVEDLSHLCSRFPYEFVCNITRRVPRLYIENGKIISIKDYFRDLYQDYMI